VSQQYTKLCEQHHECQIIAPIAPDFRASVQIRRLTPAGKLGKTESQAKCVLIEDTNGIEGECKKEKGRTTGPAFSYTLKNNENCPTLKKQ
jgi:hypothetical protein